MTSSGLTFLSWVRTGLISAVGAPPGTSGNPLDASLPLAASLPITLTMDPVGPVGYQANLMGPGDVIGIDPQQVIRTDPAPGAAEVEPNYFALIEFDRPDLPWMVTPNGPARTPTAADTRRGLGPWLCLVVVPDCTLDPPTSDRPLPRIKVTDVELPDLETAWLWCHAQVLTAAGEDLKNLLANRPERTLSRLVAPRRLRPGTDYLACVVPVFEAGRRAGLGLDPPASGLLSPAWTHGAAPRDVELPVYYSWRFSTAKVTGDFEDLAGLLKACRFGKSGVRPLNVGQRGRTLQLEGILIGDEIVPGDWPGTWASGFRRDIALRLASSADELAPPTYGCLQAGYKRPVAPGRPPLWLGDLNLDPRYRVMAALGTRVVQRYQEALVASAWEQSADIREANRLMRQAQLARAVGQVIERRINAPDGLPPDRLLQVTSAIHRQVPARAGGLSVEAAMARNVAVRASVSVPFRRIARPAGPLARRLGTRRLAAPVLRLGYAPGTAGALRPTKELALKGIVELGQISASPEDPESFATLTPKRVQTPVYPWEPAAEPMSYPLGIPYGFMSDLVVGGWVGRALDFDGIPQLGWDRLTTPLPSMPAAYIDKGGVQGILSVADDWDSSRGALIPYLRWRPGFLLEPGGAALKGSEAPGTPRAMAATDITGTGRIDIAAIWENSRTIVTPSGPGGTKSETRFDTYIGAGLDFDVATGNVRGGWTSPIQIAGDSRTPMPSFSAAATGSSLLLLCGSTLRIMTLSMMQSGIGGGYGQTLYSVDSAAVDLRGQLPDDFVQGAIAAADFGGGTGVDLLVYFVAGQKDSLRAGYRIAYDLKTSGSVGYWGETQAAPAPTAAATLDIYLGASTALADTLRAEKTRAFRDAAAATQVRQERILATSSAPPPPAPAVDATQLASDVRDAIDPTTTVEASVASRLALQTPIDPKSVSDPLQPLALTPRFRYPTFELLRDLFPDRVYPGASELPDNCVAVLRPNRSAIEAFLTGLNHEMSRELLWRGFPVRHGTFFSQFWEAGREEIAPIETWSGASRLGTHGAGGVTQASLLLVVRGELLRRIPDCVIYAAPAVPGAGPNSRTLDRTKRRDPLFSGRLDPDIRFFGFDLTPRQARGDDGSQGWYFVFQQHPTAPRFGMDEAEDGYGQRPGTWADLAWPQVAADEDAYGKLVYVDAGRGSPLDGVTLADGGSSTLTHRWGASAADMAHITLQRPVLIAIHGSDLIDKDVIS